MKSVHPSLRFLLALALLLIFLPGKVAAQGVVPARTCGKSAFLNAASAATTQIAPTANDRQVGNEIFVCGFSAVAGAADAFTFAYGSGTNCGTGTTNISPSFSLAANGIMMDNSPFFRGLSVPAGNNLCVTTTTAGPLAIIVYFDNNPL